MRFWKKCILAVMLLFLMNAAAAEASDIPLAVNAAVSDDGTYISIYVSAEKPVVLNAFTFSISYDTSVYEIYQGNDQLQGGYGYNSDFQNQYQKGGMLVHNAADSKVLFSGVNNHEQLEPFSGIIAEVTLLQYNKQAEEEHTAALDISALSISGQTVALTDAEKHLVCRIEESAATEDRNTDDPVLTNPSAWDGAKTHPQETLPAGESVEDSSMAVSGQNLSASLEPAASISSDEDYVSAASGQGGSNGDSIEESIVPSQNSKEDVKEKKQTLQHPVFIIVIMLCSLLAGMAWFYIYVRGKSKHNKNIKKE